MHSEILCKFIGKTEMIAILNKFCNWSSEVEPSQLIKIKASQNRTDISSYDLILNIIYQISSDLESKEFKSFMHQKCFDHDSRLRRSRDTNSSL